MNLRQMQKIIRKALELRQGTNSDEEGGLLSAAALLPLLGAIWRGFET